MRKPFIALLAASALAACSFAPDHKRPSGAVPPDYPAEIEPEIGAMRATDIAWQGFFADPRLQKLIGLALENNRDLRIAVSRIDRARAEYRITDSALLPTLSATGSYTDGRMPAALGGTGTSGDRYQIGVGVTSFELDFWGRVRNLSGAARARYLSTVAAERSFRLSLIRDVALNYLTAREQAERIAIAESTLDARSEGLTIAKKRLDAGVTSALDYRQSETLLTQAQSELASLRLARARTRNFSYVLIGQAVPAELPDAQPMEKQGIVRDIGPGLTSELLNNRPDIIAAEELLRAAEANIGAARAEFFPRIALTGAFGYASTQLDGLVGKDNQSWSFAPSISLPIFDWGRRRANLKMAKADAAIAVSTYDKTVQVAFREVADGLAGRRYIAEQIAAQQRSLDAQRKLASLARLRYANGVAGYLEVLDAERTLFSAEQTMVSLRSAELQNLIALYVALGGGLGAQPAVK